MSITRRPNGRFQVRWRDGAGRQRSRTFTVRADAVAFLRDAERSRAAEQLLGPVVRPVRSALTVEDFAAEWLGRQVWRPSTAELMASHLTRHVLPSIGHRLLGSVMPSELQALVRQLSERLAPATVHTVMAAARGLFAAAQADELCTRNPAASLRLPKIHRALTLPSAEQVAEILARITPRFRAIALLAASSGLRQGECLGLTVDRVDFAHHSVRVDRQLVGVGPAGLPLFGPPKTSASVRTVPVPESLTTALAEHLGQFGRGPSGILFTTPSGSAVRRQRFSDAWRPVAMAVGLEERTGLHSLRHFYASLLIRAGLSVKVVQARLGHATAAETLDTYAHLWPDDEDRTRSAVVAVGLFDL